MHYKKELTTHKRKELEANNGPVNKCIVTNIMVYEYATTPFDFNGKNVVMEYCSNS